MTPTVQKLFLWLADVDARGRDLTGVRWLSIAGLAKHQLAGSALYLALALLGAPAGAAYVACAALGVVHEWTQAQMGGSDFAAVNGGPWNGLLDVLAFLPLWPIANLWPA